MGTVSNYPNGFSNGVNIRGVPVLNSYPGFVFWVDSVNGSDGNKGTFDRPFATIDYAIGQCTASRGDLILCKAGHAETLTAASAITMDVIGVHVIGLGDGANRPTLTFGTSTAASVVISAASCSIENFVGIGNIDALTNPIHIQAADFYGDIEWRDASSTVEAARAVLTTASADRLKLKMKYYGQTGGDACVNAIRLVGVDGAEIDIDFYGKASTSIVEFVTTACTNINVTGYMYNSGTTDGSKNVIDTVTGSTWYANVTDGAAGSTFTGGSAAALASDDITAITNALYGTAGISSYPSGAAAANNVSIAEVLRYIQDQIINGTGTVLDTNTSLYGVLAGATGIPTYPAAAAAANSVSMAEVLRYVQDRVTAQMLNRNSTNYFSVLADFTSATWNTVAAHEIATVTGAVHLIILPQVTGTITSGGGTATLILGDETTTNSIITSTDAENLAVGEWWFDATDTRTLAARSIFEKTDVVIGNGKDVGYTIGTEALTGGSITFHVWWEPIDATGSVAAGTGGAL